MSPIPGRYSLASPLRLSAAANKVKAGKHHRETPNSRKDDSSLRDTSGVRAIARVA